MVNKQLLIVGICFVFSFAIIGNVFALSCSLETTCTTPTPGEGVVMALSSSSNAHGEVRTGNGNYGEKVCCEFEGTDTCRGGNNVLKLSSITNAHSETLESGGSYAEDVCFGGLNCLSTTEADCSSTDGFDLQMLSIYDATNAHLAEFSDDVYGTKICCKWETNAYWADADDINEVITLAAVGDRVVLVLNNSGVDPGNYDNVGIYENDGVLNPDDDIRPRSGALISGEVVLNGNDKSIFSGEWEITQDDYDAGKDLLIEGSPDEFYFIANGIRSPYLNIISRDEGVAFCEDFTDDSTCISCSNSLDCPSAYNSANDISKDNFGVGCGEILPDDENYETNCFCQWNSVDSKCDGGVSYVSILDKTVAPHCKNDAQDSDLGETGIDCGGYDCGNCDPVTGNAYLHCKDDISNYDETGLDCGDPNDDCGPCDYKISFPKVGSCTYVSQGEDDCADNFLEYTWTGNWAWGTNNGFSSTDNTFSNNVDDYIQANGLWYYDPMQMSVNCVGGTNVIPCPAAIQLPFFGFFGILSSLILISIIYGFLIFGKKKKI